MDAPRSNPTTEAEHSSSDDDPTMPALEDCPDTSEDKGNIMHSSVMLATGRGKESDYTTWEELLMDSPIGNLNVFNFDEGGFLVKKTGGEHDAESM